MNKLYYVLGVLLLCACYDSKPSDSMAFDKVVYIDSFPKSYRLEKGMRLNLQLVGVESLLVKDSMLIVSTSDKNGYWSFWKLPNYEDLGKYITGGKSDKEFVYSPRVANQYFVKQANKWKARIYDFNTGNILSMNIYNTLDCNTLVANIEKYELPRGLYSLICVDSSSFFCRQIDGDYTQLSRFMLTNEGKSVFENMEMLNQASIDAGYDFNILGTYCRYDSGTNRVVEASMDLNHINLYSLDSDFRLTICCGKQLDKIREVQHTERRRKKIVYNYLSSYTDFFAALYQNDTQENIYSGKAKAQTIQFYDWNGKPLVEIVLDRRINSFDIDFSTGYLYTLSYEQDEMYVYDIGEILQDIKQ